MGETRQRGAVAAHRLIMTLSIFLLAALAGVPGEPPATAQLVPALPAHAEDPLAAGRSGDPILALARSSVPAEEFVVAIQEAVARHPARLASEAEIAGAEAVRKEALAGRFPTIDVVAQSTRSFARDFGNDPEDIVERSRALGRTDAVVSVEQTLFDFGANERRVAAAAARLRAAAEAAESSADQVALNAIVAWYDVFAYRALAGLSEAFIESLHDLRGSMTIRIDQGVSAPGDLPRVESYIASSQAELARYRRQLANAEARFTEIFGNPPPPDLGRAPAIGLLPDSKEAAQDLARSTPAVERAEALARAGRQEARAAKASTWPTISAAVDAGKYGLLDQDYDVRGRVTLRHRLSGGIFARADQAEARADLADAQAALTRNEAERQAAIAWSDVSALQDQLKALESSYVASRQSRDVLAERFRAARGTLFDLLEAETGFFNVAAAYVRGIIELDAARYVLLSRTGQLVPVLDIEAPEPEGL